MKTIRNIFILGLVNFVLILGVLFAADVKSNQITAQENLVIQDNLPNVTPEPTKSSIDVLPATTSKITTTPSPVKASPEPTVITPTTDPLSGKCLVYIDGTRYDMTEFRNIHSGGDVFQCGADMTSIFLGQHPSSYMDKIAKYRI